MTGPDAGSPTTPPRSRRSSEAMRRSRDAVREGLYIGPFAEQRVFAIGLEPPPMMWIFEWDILTGDSAVLDLVYAVSARPRRRGGGRGVGCRGHRRGDAHPRGRHRRGDLARPGDARGVPRDPRPRGRHAARAVGLPDDGAAPGAVARHRIGRRPRRSGCGRATSTVPSQRRTSTRYEGDVDHPALNLTAADLGVQRAERDLAMAWLARVLLALALGWLALGLVASLRIAPTRRSTGRRRRRGRARRGGGLGRRHPPVAGRGGDRPARRAAQRAAARRRARRCCSS